MILCCSIYAKWVSFRSRRGLFVLKEETKSVVESPDGNWYKNGDEESHFIFPLCVVNIPQSRAVEYNKNSSGFSLIPLFLFSSLFLSCFYFFLFLSLLFLFLFLLFPSTVSFTSLCLSQMQMSSSRKPLGGDETQEGSIDRKLKCRIFPL